MLFDKLLVLVNDLLLKQAHVEGVEKLATQLKELLLAKRQTIRELALVSYKLDNLVLNCRVLSIANLAMLDALSNKNQIRKEEKDDREGKEEKEERDEREGKEERDFSPARSIDSERIDLRKLALQHRMWESKQSVKVLHEHTPLSEDPGTPRLLAINSPDDSNSGPEPSRESSLSVTPRPIRSPLHRLSFSSSVESSPDLSRVSGNESLDSLSSLEESTLSLPLHPSQSLEPEPRRTRSCIWDYRRKLPVLQPRRIQRGNSVTLMSQCEISPMSGSNPARRKYRRAVMR